MIELVLNYSISQDLGDYPDILTNLFEPLIKSLVSVSIQRFYTISLNNVFI